MNRRTEAEWLAAIERINTLADAERWLRESIGISRSEAKWAVSQMRRLAAVERQLEVARAIKRITAILH